MRLRDEVGNARGKVVDDRDSANTAGDNRIFSGRSKIYDGQQEKRSKELTVVQAGIFAFLDARRHLVVVLEWIQYFQP